jgi:hypothetical protein
MASSLCRADRFCAGAGSIRQSRVAISRFTRSARSAKGAGTNLRSERAPEML